MMKIIQRLIFFGFVLISSVSMGQTNHTQLGVQTATKLDVYEYYNHIGNPEWIKLFTVKSYNPGQGYWGKGGVSGRVYFVDYQGEGGSYVDFSFPQDINATQKPIIVMSGASADDLEWFAYQGSYGPGRDYYDVYVKTPNNHLGLTFLIRGNDIDPYFVSAPQPSGNPKWSYTTNPESFTYFHAGGNLGLGTITPSERLSVNGSIRAREVKVENSNWPDYVFEENYVLPTLSDLQKYISANKHLPEIPSAKEVHEDGVALGQMNKILVKKMEEMTLYIIDQDKRLKKQELLMEMLIKDNKKIKK